MLEHEKQKQEQKNKKEFDRLQLLLKISLQNLKDKLTHYKNKLNEK